MTQGALPLWEGDYLFLRLIADPDASLERLLPGDFELD